MTCGITVAPTMQTASSAEPPGSLGTKPRATAPAGGRALAHFEAEREHDHADEGGDRRLEPAEAADLHARMANAATPVRIAEIHSGRPNTSCRPSAAPTNSARSVAIATASACSHRNTTTRNGEPVAAHLGQATAGGDAELGD